MGYNHCFLMSSGNIAILQFVLSYFRPRLKDLQSQVQKKVKNMMMEYLQVKPNASRHSTRSNSDPCITKPNFIASCSSFGPKV